VNLVALRRVMLCSFVRVVSDRFVGVMMRDMMVSDFHSNQPSLLRAG
jgi:hypothetical protein